MVFAPWKRSFCASGQDRDGTVSCRHDCNVSPDRPPSRAGKFRPPFSKLRTRCWCEAGLRCLSRSGSHPETNCHQRGNQQQECRRFRRGCYFLRRGEVGGPIQRERNRSPNIHGRPEREPTQRVADPEIVGSAEVRSPFDERGRRSRVRPEEQFFRGHRLERASLR